jgi:hypothetical protein
MARGILGSVVFTSSFLRDRLDPGSGSCSSEVQRVRDLARRRRNRREREEGRE